MSNRREKQQVKYEKAKADYQKLVTSAEKKQTGPQYENEKPGEKK